MAARYDTIGVGYADRRRPDPRIADGIGAALHDARTVINVGAEAGSYEPTDRLIVAVEPSAVMAAQRPPELSPADLGRAERLPFPDNSAADAVVAVLTLHHWDDSSAGVAEAVRVAAIWRCCGVRSSPVSALRLRTVSPVASNSRRTRSANTSMPIEVNSSHAMPANVPLSTM
jgi:SAM-dependent methyltransferase